MLLLPLVFLLLVALVFFSLVKFSFSIGLVPSRFVSFHKELKKCLVEISLDCIT